jgi:hypothetical protein
LREHGTGNGLDGTGELDQQRVAGRLDDPAFMLGDSRIDNFTTDRLESGKRSEFVAPHHPRVVGDISRQWPLHSFRARSDFSDLFKLETSESPSFLLSSWGTPLWESHFTRDLQ